MILTLKISDLLLLFFPLLLEDVNDLDLFSDRPSFICDFVTLLGNETSSLIVIRLLSIINSFDSLLTMDLLFLDYFLTVDLSDINLDSSSNSLSIFIGEFVFEFGLIFGLLLELVIDLSSIDLLSLFFVRSSSVGWSNPLVVGLLFV